MGEKISKSQSNFFRIILKNRFILFSWPLNWISVWIRMTVMKKILLVLALFLGKEMAAQPYNTGIGLRLGGINSGLTLKHFVNDNTALEGIIGFGYRSFTVTGLYEKHFPVDNAPGLHWLVGGGAHIGFFRYGGSYYVYKKHNKVLYVDNDGPSRTIGGLDFILGLDYKFNGAPVNVSLDLKPFVDFFEFPTGYFDGGLSVRFVF